MDVVWDEPKRLRNLTTHGFDFVDARERFDWGSALILPTYPSKFGGNRYTATGYLNGELVTLVFARWEPRRSPSSACVSPAERNGSAMANARRRPRPLSDDEEAQLQAGIAADPDNPELTDEQLAQMRPAHEVLPPDLYRALTNRGRPKAESPKVQLTLRLDQAVVDAYRATGPGWQTRMNETLARGARELNHRAQADG